MASKIMDETSMDAKIRLYNLIREMTTGKNKTIQVEEIIIEAGAQGFIEAEVLPLLDELKIDGMIRDAGDGSIALT